MAWRILSYEARTAVDNMAIDEAILEAHLRGLVPPTLRLYSFAPQAVSLGYSQQLPDETMSAIGSCGFDLVRRPTGGRAVLHANELTYSFVGTSVSEKDPRKKQPNQSNDLKVCRKRFRQFVGAHCVRPSSGNVLALRAVLSERGGDSSSRFTSGGFLSTSVSVAYKQICQGLVEAFSDLGVPLEFGSAKSEYRSLHDCFLATTGADLQYRGKKMIGSAQLRRRGAVLQHGSILLDQDQNLMSSLIDQESGSKRGNFMHHANLYEVVGTSVSTFDLQQAIKKGFERAFGQKFEESALIDEELSLVEELRLKYLHL